tara:strand:+ start:103 stop:702 length:600 start_codon:yes stop_codon:yes gene_type:complete
MRDLILIEIYFDESIRGYIKKLTPSLYEEAHSQLMLNVMTKIDDNKLISLHESKELQYYVVAMARNMVVNFCSDFNRKYRSFLSYDVVDSLDDNALGFKAFLQDCNSNVEENLIDEEKEYLINELLLEVKNWLKLRSEKIEGAYYNEKLFNKYFSGGMTFREIADETKIPLSEIYKSIAGTNEIVLTKFQQRYDRIINQ